MRRLSGGLGRSRRSKYGAKRTQVDNIWFHSGAEARRYLELKMLQTAGHIRDLKLQPHWTLAAPLMPSSLFDFNAGDVEGKRAIGECVMDFSYEERTAGGCWRFTIEDVKGKDNAMSQWKRRHFEAQYRQAVRVVRMRPERKARKRA